MYQRMKKNFGFVEESPSPYIYYIYISGAKRARGMAFTDFDSLKKYMGQFVVEPEKTQ